MHSAVDSYILENTAFVDVNDIVQTLNNIWIRFFFIAPFPFLIKHHLQLLQELSNQAQRTSWQPTL